MNKLKIIVFVCLSFFLFAYNTEKNKQPVQQKHDFNYYQQQISSLKNLLVMHPQDAVAWESYYLALHYANIYDPIGETENRKIAMHQVIKEMEKYVPKTIEYYRCKVADMQMTGTKENDDEIISMIKKGLEIEPSDRVLLGNLIEHYELSGNASALQVHYTKLYNSQVSTYTVMEYNYNLLMSVEPNAIIFTNENNDSYPAWILQQVKGIRTDVSIVNASLLKNKSYIKRLLKQKNIALPEITFDTDPKTEKEFVKQIVLEISKKYPQTPMFFALTYPVQGFFEDSLYCTGLAYKFSAAPIDNIKLLQKNIESKFHLDYLNNCLLPSDSLDQEINSLNFNYTIPFAILYKYYTRKGESNDRINFYKGYCLLNASKRGKEVEMKNYLEGK